MPDDQELRAKTKLRIGVMVEGMRIPAWGRLMLEKIGSEGDGEICLVVVKGSPDGGAGDLFSEWGRTNFVFKAYRSIGRRFRNRQTDALAPVDAGEVFKNISCLHVKPIAGMSGEELTEIDIAQIRGYHLDVLLETGMVRLNGEIHKAARLGTWWMDSTEPTYQGRGPAGFWEVFDNQPVTGLGLYQTTGRGEAEKVLVQSYSATDPLSTLGNCNRAYWKGASFVPRQLKRARATGEPEGGEPAAQTNTLKALPGELAFGRKLAGFLARYASNRLAKLFFHTQWHLFYTFINNPGGFNLDDIARLGNLKRLKAPWGGFWSDPFILRRQDRTYIFFEEFLYKKKKAHISVLAMDEKGVVEGPQVALERPYHLSYPFLFEWEDELYMIPETAAHKSIEVYRCAAFPGRWEFCMTLMKNVTAMDTTLFLHGGKWWMFSNLKENEGASSWDELFLFSADSPLTGDWRPHPWNPIVSDVRRARPAGSIFEQNGVLYRPSQNSARGYGHSLNLNRILVLNEAMYQEETAGILQPDWERGIHGIHTFNHAHGMVVVDGKSRRLRLPSLV